jgi:hypothetical protein
VAQALNAGEIQLREIFSKTGLRIARRVGQRHEHLAATLLALPNVILDDRVAADEPLFLAPAIE